MTEPQQIYAEIVWPTPPCEVCGDRGTMEYRGHWLCARDALLVCSRCYKARLELVREWWRRRDRWTCPSCGWKSRLL